LQVLADPPKHDGVASRATQPKVNNRVALVGLDELNSNPGGLQMTGHGHAGKDGEGKRSDQLGCHVTAAGEAAVAARSAGRRKADGGWRPKMAKMAEVAEVAEIDEM